MSDEGLYIEVGVEARRVIQHDGVRTTVCLNKFEIVVAPGNDIWEQKAVQNLREWVRWRKAHEELRQPRCVPE